MFCFCQSGRGTSGCGTFWELVKIEMFAKIRVVCCRSIGFAVRQQRTFAVSANTFKSEQRSYRVVVVGGGTSGCAIASKLASRFGKGKVAIVEPSDVSF